MHSDPAIPENRFRHAAMVARLGMLVVLCTMFMGTHIPVEISHEISQHDKLLHFWAYLTLSFSMAVSWDLSSGKLQGYQYLLIWMACAFYGVADELLQIPVGRSCDAMDWVFDIAGAAVGLALFKIVRPIVYRVILLLPIPARS